MSKSELATVIATFPDKASTVRRLYLADAGFRDLCGDFALAHETLDRFRQLKDAVERPEIAEYLDLISDLSTEIAGYLLPKKHPVRGGQPDGGTASDDP